MPDTEEEKREWEQEDRRLREEEEKSAARLAETGIQSTEADKVRKTQQQILMDKRN